MGDNYVDIPIMVLKLRSRDSIVAGQFIGPDTSGGYITATDSATTCGMMALEATTDSAQYFDAIVIGTVYMATPDTVPAGQAVCWNDTIEVDCANADRNHIGTMIDGSDTSGATRPCTSRIHRVLLWGQWFTNDSVWV